GVAVPHLDYRDRPPGKPPIYETSYLTLRSRAGLFPPSPPKRGRGGKNQDRVLGVPAPGLSEPRP
ncbi:MAG TPA: hypothetical protein VFA26_17045, partial [Gemmataceae bacterium]|nr:hypothetical protein [Gemmataceae bacterium]